MDLLPCENRSSLASLTHFVSNFLLYSDKVNYSIFSISLSTTALHTSGLERLLKAVVISGNCSQDCQAVFFPRPKNEEVVSHPVKA